MDFSSSAYKQGTYYAWAAFADVGVYQVVKYNIVTKMIEPIEGESLYFNVESQSKTAVFEYVQENDLTLPDSQKLKPFQSQLVTVNGLKDILPSSQTIIKTHVYDGDSIKAPNAGGHQHTNEYSVIIAGDLLKTYWGYTKVRVKGSYEIRAVNGSPDKQHIWIDLDGSKIHENTDLKVDGTAWKSYSFEEPSVDISKFKANSKFRFGFESLNHGFLGMGDYGWWFNTADVEFILEK
jgi:hypothetical protein